VNYLLDTNVVSEWVKPVPNAGVVTWLAEVDEDRVFLSVITLTEIRYGIERLPEGRRRERLAAWLAEELPVRFQGRVLDIDHRVAETWGVMMARSEKKGLTLGTLDACFAATAEAHGLTLVTRDRNLQKLGVSLFDPWRGQRS
jgi:toxin FitB